MLDPLDAAAGTAFPAAPEPDYEAAVRQAIIGERASAARLGYMAASQTNPDEYAQALKRAGLAGVPVQTALSLPDEVRRQADMASVPFDALAEVAPATAALLADVERAKLAHDDVQSLGVVEGALRFMGNTGRAGWSGLQRASAGVVGLAQAPLDVAAALVEPAVGTILPANPVRPVAQAAADYRQWIEAQSKGNMPRAEGILASGYYSGIGSLASNIAAVPLAFLPGGQAAAMSAMVAPVGGQAYGEARDKGNEILPALSFGASQAAIEYATEKIPVSWLVKDVKGGASFLSTLGRQALAEVPGEQVATVLQDLNEWATLNPEKPFSSYLADRPGAAAQTLIATLVGTGGQTTIVKGVERAARIATGEDQRAASAQQQAAALAELNQQAAASKLLEREPQTFEDFAKHAADGGQVFIAPDALMQSGVADQVRQASPAVAAQFDAAVATGSPIAIPAEEYAARIAPADFAPALIEHLATTPDGMTLAEAREYQATQGEQLQQQFEQAVAQAQDDATFKASAEQVRTRVLDNLNTVGRFTPAVNEAYSALVAAHVATRAAQLGMTPEAFFEKRQLRVVAEGLGSDALNQRGKIDAVPESNAPGPQGAAQEGATKGNAGTSKFDQRFMDNDMTGLAERAKRVAYAEDGYRLPNLSSVLPKNQVPPESTHKTVTLYRGVPASVSDARVRPGDWVSLSKEYAERHGTGQTGRNKIVSVTVPASDVVWAGTEMTEFFYAPQGLAKPGERAVDLLNRLGKDGFDAGTNPNEQSAPESDGAQVYNQAARGDRTGTPEFKKWFSDSKVVDAEGKPLVVYRYAKNESDIAGGVRFFSKEADYAESYFEEVGRGDGLTAAVYLSLRDPLVVDLGAREFSDPVAERPHIEKAMSDGRDGVVFRNGGDEFYVAFRPEQIKSAIGNNGNFDPNDPDILHQAARGAFSPEQLTIALLKGADLSTFLHESGHFFFESDIGLASELVASQREGASLTPGEQRVLADVGALLTWHGLKGDVAEQLAEWHNLPFEEKRSAHERTAESFERYLVEGQSPSLELAPYFQRFRAWLLNVYRSLKDFLAGHPEAGTLTPEVRQVFDRMLASTDQIQLAEQGRSMMPLFENPEQAGMTPEAFEAYQALGVDATNAAVQDFQARALRDMRWLKGKRLRALKDMQAAADTLRQNVAVDVRQEVMREPVYRAWRFLTSRQQESDRIGDPATAPKSGATLNPEVDTLLTAVAKLGGLSRATASQHLGVHADEFKRASGVFGKPLFRKTGGLSADAMAERLVELGYLTPNEHGRADLRQLEDKIADELGGSPHHSTAWNLANALPEMRAGRLDLASLREMYGAPEQGQPPAWQRVKDLKMTATKGGIHPDIVAEMFGFTSGDHLVQALTNATPLADEIEARTDQRMLEQHGELATPAAIETAADKAIHNEVRAQLVATEANALARATGGQKVMNEAARAFARAQVARVQVRHLSPTLYSRAQARAAKAAAAALKKGDLATAAAEKRNELVQTHATRAAHDARTEVDKGLDYLRKFDGDVKGLDADYADQIHAVLERYDLRRATSLREIGRRKSLVDWVESQREQGFEPDLPPGMLDEARRQSYKELTVEEFRGLVDGVRQIEHLGRLKNKLLTAADQREYEAVRDEITASIREHAGDRHANTRTATTAWGERLQAIKRFGAAHIKAATWARIMDGGKDGGPLWEYLVRPANERANQEATMRAEATEALARILKPLTDAPRRSRHFPSINRSLTMQERFAIALNLGNEGNAQRLLGGEGWTMQQLQPVLQTLTAGQWQAVQAVWDHFESYRPAIAAKERRVYGKEPAWVEPRAFEVATADGSTVALRGGYYPIKYDPAASQRAEEHADAEDAKRQMQGAYTSATTRRSFTKTRAEEVNGRPLLYSLAGVYSGLNDVIHDLAWHEWLIDANRLLRSKSIDTEIRQRYGPEAKAQLKSWVEAVADGGRGAQNAGEGALGWMRRGVSMAGLGFNVVSAAMQPLGLTQSMVRVGTPWVARGIAQYIAGPISAARRVNEMSAFMANRNRTRFRELNELRNQVRGQNVVRDVAGRYGYWLMMRFQQMVDVPTWLGAYEKAVSQGNDEARARDLADQAVIDSQGGGEVKDLAAIERGNPAMKLFTVFYSFMNTALNLGVAQGATAQRTVAGRAKLAADMLLLYTVPAVLGSLLKDALTPGDGGDDDWEKLARKLAAEQLSYLMGLFLLVREFQGVAKIVTGAGGARDYSGPAGSRLVGDVYSFATQASQGEFDDAFRKATINLVGDLLGLPAAQANRTITGVQALAEGKTENPAAIAFGFQQKK